MRKLIILARIFGKKPNWVEMFTMYLPPISTGHLGSHDLTTT